MPTYSILYSNSFDTNMKIKYPHCCI